MSAPGRPSLYAADAVCSAVQAAWPVRPRWPSRAAGPCAARRPPAQLRCAAQRGDHGDRADRHQSGSPPAAVAPTGSRIVPIEAGRLRPPSAGTGRRTPNAPPRSTFRPSRRCPRTAVRKAAARCRPAPLRRASGAAGRAASPRTPIIARTRWPSMVLGVCRVSVPSAVSPRDRARPPWCRHPQGRPITQRVSHVGSAHWSDCRTVHILASGLVPSVPCRPGMTTATSAATDRLTPVSRSAGPPLAVPRRIRHHAVHARRLIARSGAAQADGIPLGCPSSASTRGGHAAVAVCR